MISNTVNTPAMIIPLGRTANIGKPRPQLMKILLPVDSTSVISSTIRCALHLSAMLDQKKDEGTLIHWRSADTTPAKDKRYNTG